MTLRTNICKDLDLMILEVKCEGSRHPPMHIINIYNQTELGETQEQRYMTDRLASINLHPGTPMIITGDWNLHHNSWDSMVEVESTLARTQEVADSDWLKGQGFSLCSERDIHTRSGTGSQQDLVINLTFANEIATGQGIIHWKWEENPGREFCIVYPALCGGSEQWVRPRLKALAACLPQVQWMWVERSSTDCSDNL